MKEKGYTNTANFVLTDKRLSGKDKLVYWAIKAHAFGKKNWSIPGNETISRLSGASNKHISTHTQKLEDTGYIKVVQRGGGKSNKYFLLPLKVAPGGFVSTESHDADDDSQFRRDDSHLTQDDSHLRTTEADKPPVDTTHDGGVMGEELQGRNTSRKKETTTFTPEEEKKTDAAVEPGKKPGSISLQESETQAEDSGKMNTSEGRPFPLNTYDAQNEEFTPSEMLATLRSNSAANEWMDAAEFCFIRIFQDEYSKSEGTEYLLLGGDLAKAKSQARVLIDRFAQYIVKLDDGDFNFGWLVAELQDFIVFAFKDKKGWVYKGNTPGIGLLLHAFSTVINRYEKKKHLERQNEAINQRFVEQYAAHDAETRKREESLEVVSSDSGD